MHGRGATTVVLAGALVTVLLLVIFDLDRPHAGPDPRPRRAARRAARLDDTAAGSARPVTVNLVLGGADRRGRERRRHHRHAARPPPGSRGELLEDGDRAAGVFGVLATGFAVLLGFVVFLAFQSFDTSRSGAVAEAQIVVQQFETAQLMPARGAWSLLG